MVGVIAVAVGQSVLTLFTGYELDRFIPAVTGLVMGLHLLWVLKLNLPVLGRLRVKRPASAWGAFALGVPFGLVVTPCTIPIFLTLVTYLALQANVLHGALLMVAYALGRGLVLGVVAYSAGLFKTIREGRRVRVIERVSGGVILGASVYLLFFYSMSSLSMQGM